MTSQNLNKTDNQKLQELADLLFPNTTKTIADFDELYPIRNLADGAEVTRFAPSPTGFVHIGGIYACLVSQTVARQTEGIFFLRIEDTDKKREVANGVEEIVTSLKNFNIIPVEGQISETHQVGKYGPYKQSERVEIYNAFAKELVKLGRAYPCFCTKEELETLTQNQMAQKAKPGYYGAWAKHKNITNDEVKTHLANKETFTLRLRSNAVQTNIAVNDLIRGKLTPPANDQDTVLIKSDGLPTYHFAHIVDDYLMKTTLVIRGEEWLPSLPLHIELFEAFGFTPTKYAHIPLIMKMEGSSKRKLSKRKDPEAAVSFYQKHGYHPNAVLEYLTNLANSGFEDWRRANPSKALEDFNFDISKMGKSGALFNIDKLNNIGKEVISKFSAQEKYKYLVEWASKYDPELNKLIEKNEDFVVNVFNVETEANIRKDISGWSEFRAQYGFFFNEIFDAGDLDIQVLKENSLEKDGLEFLNKYKNFENRNEWQEYHTRMALDLGYAPDTKTYKENLTAYKGHIGNIMTVLRLALTKSTRSPNLFDVARVLGPQETTRRIEQFINMFDKARTNKLS